MRSILAILVALAGFALTASQNAQAEMPIVFQQSVLEYITFGARPEPIKNETKTSEATSDEAAAAPTPSPASKPQARRYRFQTKIRPATALNQRDLFSIDPFAHTQALLFVYQADELAGFYAPHIQKPVDMLAINAQGTIIEIVPQAVPSALDATQYSVDQPVRALLLLPAGTVDTEGMRPGDRVLHKLFTAAPEQRM